MKPLLIAGALSLVMAGSSQAQVYIRAPFVRVGVGGPGVSVRAPFVNLYIPRSTPAYYPAPAYYAPGYHAPGYYGPGYGGSGITLPRHYSSDFSVPPFEPRLVPGATREFEPRIIDPALVPSTAKVIERPAAVPAEERRFDPPEPRAVVEGMTVEEFVKSFKPRAGNFELDLVNPVTKKLTNVRFTLPEGMLMSVQLKGNSIEFRYGAMSYVRITFDRDGAEVTSR